MVTSHTDNRQCKTYCCTGYDKNGGRENNFTDTNQRRHDSTEKEANRSENCESCSRRLDSTMMKFELINKVDHYILY